MGIRHQIAGDFNKIRRIRGRHMGDLINPGKTAPGVPNLGTPQPDSPEITNAQRYCAGQRTPTRLKFLPAKPRPKSRKTQPLAKLLKRVRTCGGYATIYSLRNDGVTRVIACIKQESALPTNPTDLPHAVAASPLREFHLKPRRESRASTSCTHRSNRSCFQNRNLVSILKTASATHPGKSPEPTPPGFPQNRLPPGVSW